MDSIINVLEAEKIPFEKSVLGITIDCGGNPGLFMKAVQTLYFHMENWTYDQELGLTYTIDSAFEKIQIADASWRGGE